MTNGFPVQNLPSRWEGRAIHLMARVSFEERSLVVARSLVGADVRRCTCFASSRRSERTEGHLAEFQRIFPSACMEELDTSDPLATAKRLFDVLSAEMAETGLCDLVLDITSFRREELLMLLAVLRTLSPPQGTRSELLYIGAGLMADRLSGQVTALRSVVGYAGEMWPSRPTCLVILIGFEFARARSIVENYEPKTLILGKGMMSESISPGLGVRNDEFYRELHSQYDNVVGTFEFSARDPFSTAEAIERAVRLDSTSNVIVAPLHTKLSTLGAGLFASRHPEVQMCYAQVDSYNELEYSSIGSNVFSVDLDALL